MSCDEDASFRYRINQTERMRGSAESSTYWRWILDEHFPSWAAAGSKPNIMEVRTRSRLLEVSCCRTQPWTCWLDSDICIAVHSVICCQLYSWNAKYNRWWRALKRWKCFNFIRKTCLYSKSTTIKWAAFSCYVEGDNPRDLIRNQAQLCKLVNSPITV